MQTERLQESLGKKQLKMYLGFIQIFVQWDDRSTECHRLSALVATKVPPMQVVIKNTSTSPQLGPH